jgi:osmotically-inducible protein OsmY
MDNGMNTGTSTLRILMLLFAGALLAGCGALIVGGVPAGGHDTAAQRSTSIETSHDAAITSSINSRYVKDHLVDALAIRVTTYQGVVTLQGSVRTQAAATRAVDLARSTPNVRRVVSRLTVTP